MENIFFLFSHLSYHKNNYILFKCDFDFIFTGSKNSNLERGIIINYDDKHLYILLL